MKILEYSYINRSIAKEFQIHFYSNFMNLKSPSHRFVGKNFSFCIINNNHMNILVLFDFDDGSGITPCRPGILDGDCKIDFVKLERLKLDHKINKTIVLKAQLNPYENNYYPFNDICHPMGYFCGSYHDIINISHTLQKGFNEKDIDVLWIGTVNENATPWNWPEDQDINRWPTGQRIKGYNVLKEISNRRTDLNIVVSNKKVSKQDYFDLISRTKICLELPGCGWFTRRFVENVCFGKCILSMTQQQSLPFELKEDYHYASMGKTIDQMEKNIDDLLKDQKSIERFERNSLELRKEYDPVRLARSAFEHVKNLKYNLS